MKIVGKIILWVLGILLVLFIVALLFLNRIVVNGFNKFVPPALGVPASLERAIIRPLRGYTSLDNLRIGNPEGFKTDSLFDLGHLSIRMNKRSLLSDTLVIEEIIIRDVAITYEQGLRRSNFSTLLAALSSDDEKEKAAPASDKPGKKVIIEKLRITGAQVNVSVTGAMGHSVPIVLPEIQITDLGKKDGGVSAMDAVLYVMGTLGNTIGSVISGSVQLLGNGAKALGGGLVSVSSNVLDGAAGAVSATVDGAWALGQGAVNAAGAVVGGAANAGVAVGSAVVDGTETVVGGIWEAGKAVGGGVAGAGRAVGGALNHLNPFSHSENSDTKEE
ncbi:MAG: AsmA family protein [Verrucomicrobiota bacterium]|jgi:hypothetical protein|nr:AsmA family protein [Verrucomicrobiota bacterium]